MEASRRGFLGLLCAPAIIKVADLMPIKMFEAEPFVLEPYIDFSFHRVAPYENVTEMVMSGVLKANRELLEGHISHNNALYRRLKLKDAGDKWIK